MMIKQVATALSPRGKRGRLSVLIFHRVLPQVDALFPHEQDVRRFDEVLSWVGRWFQVLSLEEAVVRLQNGGLPARAAAITFDDGYADNATQALPVLQHHGMMATFFVATGFLDGGRMWNDSIIESIRAFPGKVLDLREVNLGAHPLETLPQRRAAIESLLGQIKYLEPASRCAAVAFVKESVALDLPENLMMSSRQVRQLHQAGMQIGAHTCTHPILARLPDVQALGEIQGSKRTLEALIDEPVNLFAYPNGRPDNDYQARHARMVQQAGFTGEVTTAPGAASMHSDVYQLPRFSPWDKQPFRYGARLVANMLKTPQLAVI